MKKIMIIIISTSKYILENSILYTADHFSLVRLIRLCISLIIRPIDDPNNLFTNCTVDLNFVSILPQMKKFSIEAFNSDRSLYMSAIWANRTTSDVDSD